MPVVVALVVGLVTALVLVVSMRRNVLVPPVVSEIPSTEENGRYSRQEVARHDLPDDAWIIVDSKVYNITDYIDDHPGGSSILNNLGADNTKAVLEGPQHPETVRDILNMHFIGEVTD